MKTLSRKVKIHKDWRWCWYGKKTIEAELFVTPKLYNTKKRDVCILLISCDDFMMENRIPNLSTDEEIKDAWDKLLKVWNSMPNVLTQEWCDDNGFVNW